MTWDEWGMAWDYARGSGASPLAIESGLTFHSIDRGGIVGSIEITDCVMRSESRWFIGPIGFVLRDPQPLPFVACSGRLGFFDVPDAIFQGARS